MPRPLRRDEYEVLASLLSASPNRDRLLAQLSNAQVDEMVDGGMGSLRFLRVHALESQAVQIAAAHYTDEDGVPVSITVNVDREGNLLELDIFKADFSPLVRFPRVGELRIEKLNG